jgi:protoporphyrinogen/coproporphyrinogen III oxidase
MSATNVDVVDVVIVGAGIAGLSAAYELQKRGLSFVILERGPRVGGVIFSEKVGEYTIDGGPDSLLTQKPEAIRLCEELGLGDRLVPTSPPRLAFIQRGGRLHPLPASSVLGIPTRLGPFIRTGLFTWAGKLRMGAEVFVPPRRDDGDESIGSFMRRRFGDEAVTYLAEPLLAGIHAGDVERLSIHALFPRFVETERKYGSLLRAFRRQPRPAASTDGVFRSLPGGLSELVDALANALPASAIRLNTPATRLRLNPHRVETAQGDMIAGRAVIIAAPAYATSGLLRDVDATISQLCGEIEYASSGTIAMAFDRSAVAHPLNGSGFVVPRAEGSGILAASWLSSKWPYRAPEGRVLMRAFVGGGRDPEALQNTDGELVTRALSALKPLLGIAGEPLMTRVYRFERASAQHEVGHVDRMAAIDRALAARPGLYVTGSGFRGVGIPDCVSDARATARKVSECLASSAA